MALKGISLDPSWYHRLVFMAMACALSAGLLRLIFFDWDDPIHCNALLSTGTWLDDEYRNWQPDGCMLHTYQSSDVSHCLASRRVVFAGDSVTRTLYFQFINIADASLPKEPLDDGAKHSDYHFISRSQTKLDFFWDPFLNTTSTLSVIDAKMKGSTLGQSERPALLVLGSGLWYLRYADSSGGLAAWEANTETHISTVIGARSKPADEVVFLPVEEVVASKLSPDRLDTMHSSDVDAMNSDLYHRIKPPADGSYLPFWGSPPNESISLPLVFNRMLVDSQTHDGLHFAESIVRAQANILLNLRCNDQWPKTFPMDKTCCRKYPWPVPAHFIVLTSVLLFTCISLYRSYASASAKGWAVDNEYLSVIIFGAAVCAIYLADRTGLWLKEQKQFTPLLFGFLCFLSLAAGLASVQRADKDLGFLNRDQTDEWKGWMQIAILIYHYLGASKISGIYNPIRVLVASYLFMTGYGHTTFYLKKTDFGYLRVFQVLVRLNLLTLILAYTMNTDYLSYYFAPLVSMWFLVVYLTLRIGSQFNDKPSFLFGKILISMVLFAAFMSQTWLLETLFRVLDQVFFIHWSAREWSFRVTLDQYVVYCGMLTALATIKLRDLRLMDHPMWPTLVRASVVLSALVLLWFMAFEIMQESKFTYNAWHPYISILPIIAFVTLRNATPFLRSCHSCVFAFIGKCSLETFIIQYHLWLAGDTKGILLLIPGTRWRALNFLLSTVIFVYVSHQVAWATGGITAWLCGTEKKALPTTRETTSASASSATNSETVPLTVDDSPIERNTPGLLLPQQRWVDRLAASTSRRRSPGFKLWEGGPTWYHDLRGRMIIWAGLMWVANALWTNP